MSVLKVLLSVLLGVVVFAIVLLLAFCLIGVFGQTVTFTTAAFLIVLLLGVISHCIYGLIDDYW